MKRIWTLAASGLLLVVTAALVLFAPTGFVVWSPGSAVDLVDPANPVIQVQSGAGAPGGHILATSMVATGRASSASLAEIVVAYWSPNHAVLPWDAVYSPGQTAAEAAEADRQATEASREQALAAGAAAADVLVEPRPKVLSVRQSGPAYGLLLPGDLILTIDNTQMAGDDEARDYIRTKKKVGDPIVFTVQRGEKRVTITIPKLAGSSSDGTVPTAGVTLGPGFWYSPRISVTLETEAGAASQGLALALATYDLVLGRDIAAGTTVAAVGRVGADGTVSQVSGINEHAMSAWTAGADWLIIPRANCADVEGRFAPMTIVPVQSLDEAITALDGIGIPGTAPPHC